MFHILAGSCAGHLLREWGVDKFMRVYTAKDAEAAIRKETGKPARRWKEAWAGGVRWASRNRGERVCEFAK